MFRLTRPRDTTPTHFVSPFAAFQKSMNVFEVWNSWVWTRPLVCPLCPHHGWWIAPLTDHPSSFRVPHARVAASTRSATQDIPLPLSGLPSPTTPGTCKGGQDEGRAFCRWIVNASDNLLCVGLDKNWSQRRQERGGGWCQCCCLNDHRDCPAKIRISHRSHSVGGVGRGWDTEQLGQGAGNENLWWGSVW